MTTAASNFLLGCYDRIGTATLSGGAWSAGAPRTNLATDDITQVARTTNLLAASTQFDFDLGQSRALRIVDLRNHNLSLGATWRLTLGTTAGASNVYDTGWQQVWRMTFDNELLQWESPSWWFGTASDEYLGHPFDAMFALPDWYTARYGRIEILDTSNAAGFIQIGHAFIGNAIQTSTNPEIGLQDTLDDLTTSSRASSGRRWYDPQRRQRGVLLEFKDLSQAEADLLYEVMRYHGTAGMLVYAPYSDDPGQMQRYGYAANLVEMSKLDTLKALRRGLPMNLQEVF